MRSIHGVAQSQALKVERLEYAERKFQEIINDDSKTKQLHANTRQVLNPQSITYGLFIQRLKIHYIMKI